GARPRLGVRPRRIHAHYSGYGPANEAPAPSHQGGVVKLAPKLIVFDVDGVLVDVHGSFHRSILETVKHFTGCRFTYAHIQRWKSRSGYNDDWRLSTDWINSLGGQVKYAQVKRIFQKIYWGTDGTRGNVWRERWLVPARRLARCARRNCDDTVRASFFTALTSWRSIGNEARQHSPRNQRDRHPDSLESGGTWPRRCLYGHSVSRSHARPRGAPRRHGFAHRCQRRPRRGPAPYGRGSRHHPRGSHR